MKRVMLSILLTPVFLVAACCVTLATVYVFYLIDMATKKVGDYLSFVPFRDIYGIGLSVILIYMAWRCVYDFLGWLKKRRK